MRTLFVTTILGTLLWHCPLLASPLEDFYKSYEKFIKTHWKSSVVIHGVRTTAFDYKGMHAERKKVNSNFQQALDALKKIDIVSFKKGNEEKTFWINAYNFGAMKLVLEHYPVDTIRSMKISLIKHPWSIDALQIGKDFYSLTQIEKDMLLKKYDDPRIVFAVSCAAVSCPDRTNEIFRPAVLDQQMDDMIQQFFKNDQKGLQLNKNQKKLKLAWILKKDGHLFTSGKNVDVLDFVVKYIERSEKDWIIQNKSDLKIEYFDHDWALNDFALKDDY